MLRCADPRPCPGKMRHGQCEAWSRVPSSQPLRHARMLHHQRWQGGARLCKEDDTSGERDPWKSAWESAMVQKRLNNRDLSPTRTSRSGFESSIEPFGQAMPACARDIFADWSRLAVPPLLSQPITCGRRTEDRKVEFGARVGDREHRKQCNQEARPLEPRQWKGARGSIRVRPISMSFPAATLSI